MKNDFRINLGLLEVLKIDNDDSDDDDDDDDYDDNDDYDVFSSSFKPYFLKFAFFDKIYFCSARCCTTLHCTLRDPTDPHCNKL